MVKGGDTYTILLDDDVILSHPGLLPFSSFVFSPARLGRCFKPIRWGRR